MSPHLRLQPRHTIAPPTGPRAKGLAAFLALALGVLGGGCGLSSVDTSFDLQGGAADPSTPPTEDLAADGGYESDAEARATADASVVVEAVPSSLCCVGSACRAPSTCFPDDAPSVDQCESPPRPPPAEAGSNASSDAGATSFACHVNHAVRADAGAGGPTCTAAGPGKDGDQCLKPTDCAAGFECVGSPGKCRQYCCDGACGSSRFCDIQTTSVGSGKVPVCTPVRSCKLLARTGCADGETCAIVNDDDGTTSCVAVGTVQVGSRCEEAHCAANLTCLGEPGSRRCYQLCDKTDNAPCPKTGERCKGSAPLFKDVNIGVCQR